MLQLFVIALLLLCGRAHADQSHPDLGFNLCAAFNSESFFCTTVLGHFCTYCTKPDAPPDASDKHTCVTKKGVKRAIAGEILRSDVLVTRSSVPRRLCNRGVRMIMLSAQPSPYDRTAQPSRARLRKATM